ncbi:microtubule-associated protein 10-like [Clytia hemisphaerica]|uniref:Uncharacterized protein n=1 Tax=Clytia hemisphaerica TaxID=252671 RepID=A0A7M5X6X8_9CNID
MPMEECLFSLELYIQDIQNLELDCSIPAVAFRFLDYPTIIIYYTELSNIDDINQKMNSDDLTGTGVAGDFDSLRNSLDGYSFNKGKSCLFKQSFEKLKKSVQQIPLYITLVDCIYKDESKKQPKLLGVASLPLLSLIKDVEKMRGESGIVSLAVASKKEKIQLFDLMGTIVGSIRFCLKLTCYGNSLLRHVTVQEKKDTHINILLNNLSLEEENANAGARKVKEPSQLKGQSKTPEPLHEIFPADGTKAISVNERKFPKDTSWQIRKKKKIRRIKRETSYEEIITEHDNMFRPPPLFLNLQPDENHRIDDVSISSEERIKRKSRYLTETKFEEYEEEEISSFTEDEEPVTERWVKGTRGYQMKMAPDEGYRKNDKEIPSDSIETKTDSEHMTFKHVKKSMPILCSLVSEIAKFNQFLNGEENRKTVNTKPTHCDCTKSEPLVSEIASPNDQKKKVNFPKEKSIDSKNERNNSQKPLDRPKVKTTIPRTAKLKRDYEGEKAKRQKKLKTRKKALPYGLTRTQKLRYAMTHQGEIPRNQELNNNSNNIYSIDHLNTLEKYEEVYDEKEAAHPAQEQLKDVGIPTTQKTSQLVDASIQTSLERLMTEIIKETQSDEKDASDTGENSGNKQTASQVGFHSPFEPRPISPSDLFDDNKTWSTTSVTNQNTILENTANQDSSFTSRDEKTTNRKPSFNNGYSDESFASEGTISGTSSVSLPLVSNYTDSASPMKIDDTIKQSSAKSFSPDPRRSVQSMTSRQSSHPQSAISRTLKSSDGESLRSKTRTNSNMTRHSSQSSRYSNLSQSSKSSRDSPVEGPKQSAYSPMKSNYRRPPSGDQQANVLNVNIPTAFGVSDTLQTTSSFGDSLDFK